MRPGKLIMTSWVIGAVTLAATVFATCAASAQAPSPVYAATVSETPDMTALHSAVFPLLDLLAPSGPAGRALAEEPALAALARAVGARVRDAASACESQAAMRTRDPAASTDETRCTSDALRWTSEETALARAAAERAFARSPALRTMVREQMRPSGRYALHAGKDDAGLFLAAWDDVHAHIDRAVRVYALGEKPRFADIDSVIYSLERGSYRGLLRHLVREIGRRNLDAEPAWNAPARLALELLVANRRWDAVSQAALEVRENGPTAARLKTLDWTDWPYTVILVPGHSPELAYEPLNPNAKLRIRRGIESYRAGMAPVIVVSGGTLRPVGTTFNEALEMKRHILSTYPDIPASAILIDPVARHTTTNMRNTVRLIMKYGAPLERPALVVGNSVPNIASERFRLRCTEELGYVPFEPIQRLDFERLSFRPLAVSRHHDASDPMDP